MYAPVHTYVHSMHEIYTDYTFWKSIIDKAISKYESEGITDVKNELFPSIFSVYDLSKDTGDAYSYVYPKDIPFQKDSFFRWVANHAILRAYNSLEILLYSVIMEEYLGKVFSIKDNKRNENNIKDEVTNYFKTNGLKLDSKHNKHLLEYLGYQSPEVKEFLQQKVRIDLDTTWQYFFEFIYILRNVVAHTGMIINLDTMNNIKKIAKKLYNIYFKDDIVIDKLEKLILLNPVQDQFPNVLSFINDFALNMVKHIKKEEDFQFLSGELTYGNGTCNEKRNQ